MSVAENPCGYWRFCQIACMCLGKKDGADDPNRTDDLLITSELLYQLSYVGA